ncbi:hypothetical protein [Couchioplanes azureus]|uniref:hypothetical protein n=1 Tax=Couchioplanes caeruleus TaxID=56438 RepID=UPI0016701669|nr:hypothetical protein [Couchioplanes caeruleus]GGQ79914.1 hypothetical protein GCM10010166_57570 [Couchioplanes caeruleus subsp. azureus]
MITRAPRSAASLLSAAILATGALSGAALAPAPAYAAGVATAVPLRFVLPTVDKATDVLAVGGNVWVAAGNGVLIASPSGTVGAPVNGLLGAKALTLSPDGQSVYVSASTGSKIFQLSTSGAVLGSWTAQNCPGESAVAGGALYYVYGCAGATAGIARLDLSTHEDKSVLTKNLIGMTAAGETLVTYTTGGQLTSFAIGADGGLTEQADKFTSTTYDAALSPDGTQLITTDYGNGYGVARYDSATLTPAGTFETGAYPNAVAWSPDGTKFAGILDASYETSPVHVFSAQDGAVLTRATNAGTTTYQSLAHEASWSADGRYIYSLAQGYTGNPSLVVTPAAGQAKAPVTVAVKAASAYGRNLTVTVRTTNRPGARVTVTVTQNGTATKKSLTTDKSGVATLSLAARASGTVTARTAGDLSYLAASATARFSTPSVVTAKLTGQARTRSGVAQYTSYSKVRLNIQTLPKHRGKVTISLQHRSGGTWKTDQKGTVLTATDGTVQILLTGGRKKVTFRFVVKAVADSVAGASPTVISQSLIVN